MRIAWLSLAAFALAIPSWAGGPKVEPTRGPVKVFVTAKAASAAVAADELKTRQEKARAAEGRFDTLAKEIKSQFKGGEKNWPPDKRSAYYDALYENNMAWTEVWFVSPNEKDKSDSAEDVRRSLSQGWVQKKGWIGVADTRETADLVLEVVGRYGQAKFLIGGKSLFCDIVPSRIGLDRLSKIPADWPPRSKDGGFTNLVGYHWFKADAPFFRFSVTDKEQWRDVAAKIPWVLNGLVMEYYEVLKPAE